MASKTESYRNHHLEVRALAAQIEGLLDLSSIHTDPAPVAAVIRELFGKFGVHLAIEDAALYPRLSVHADSGVRQVAKRFQREMGGLKTQFDEYRSRWPGPTAISRDPRAFVGETRKMLDTLQHRIEREDNELYDLYDRVA